MNFLKQLLFGYGFPALIHTRIASANSIVSANSRPDLTEHWIRTQRQSSNVMARKMYGTRETSTELQWVSTHFSSWNCKEIWLPKRKCPQLGTPSQTRFLLIIHVSLPSIIFSAYQQPKSSHEIWLSKSYWTVWLGYDHHSHNESG